MGEGLLIYVLVLLVAGLLMYRVQLFHKRTFWYLSYFQIFLLIVVPGLLIPRLFNYIEVLSKSPVRDQLFLSDQFWRNVILLAVLYGYGGTSIHAVTKMLAERGFLQSDSSGLGEMNRFYHLTFSHTLVYASVVVGMVGITMLELNHVPLSNALGVWTGLGRGVVLGALMLIMMRNYTLADKNDYQGRWLELRWVFAVGWVGFVLMLYVIRQLDQRITDYQLLLPALVGLAVLSAMNVFLMVRRVKRGWRVSVRWSMLARYWRGDNET